MTRIVKAILAIGVAILLCSVANAQSRSPRSQYYANQVLRRPVVSPYVFLGPGNGLGFNNWGLNYFTIVQPLFQNRAAAVNNSIAIDQLQQQIEAQQNYAPPPVSSRTGWFGRTGQSRFMNHSHYYGASVR